MDESVSQGKDAAQLIIIDKDSSSIPGYRGRKDSGCLLWECGPAIMTCHIFADNATNVWQKRCTDEGSDWCNTEQFGEKPFICNNAIVSSILLPLLVSRYLVEEILVFVASVRYGTLYSGFYC